MGSGLAPLQIGIQAGPDPTWSVKVVGTECCHWLPGGGDTQLGARQTMISDVAWLGADVQTRARTRTGWLGRPTGHASTIEQERSVRHDKIRAGGRRR